MTETEHNLCDGLFTIRPSVSMIEATGHIGQDRVSKDGHCPLWNLVLYYHCFVA
jgi:hypothetical protein